MDHCSCQTYPVQYVVDSSHQGKEVWQSNHKCKHGSKYLTKMISRQCWLIWLSPC